MGQGGCQLSHHTWNTMTANSQPLDASPASAVQALSFIRALDNLTDLPD